MTLPTGLITTIGWEVLADMFTGESADTITKMKIGYGPTAETIGDTDLEHEYTDGGFEVATLVPTFDAAPVSPFYSGPTLFFTHTFTNTSGVARTVREVGLFTTSGDALVYRKAYITLRNGINMDNYCVVSPGNTITFEITFTFSDTAGSASVSIPDCNITYTIDIYTLCIGSISGTIQIKMKIGYGYTPVSGSDTDCEHPYTDYGFEEATVTGTEVVTSGRVTTTFINTFTSSNATERVVREVALFTLVDEFLGRVVFDENDIQNLCLVPAGKQISVTIILADLIDESRLFDATANIDLTTFSHPGPIDYNGIVLPNASVLPYRDSMGKKVWQFLCSTKVVADREKAIRYAGPISTGRSATGKQYVISSYRSGVLYISGDNTYYNVYMAEPVEVETFGQTYFFTVTIYESSYPEVV